MTPGNYNITTPSNATFSLLLNYLDASGNTVNLTGYQGKMQVLDHGTPVIELTTTNGMIVLGSTNPNITLTIPVSTVATLTCPNGLYDLVLVSPGGIQTALLAGTFVIVQGITS